MFSADRLEQEAGGGGGGFPPMSMDPLMRRIEGAPIIPPGALLHSEIPVGRHRRNRISEWVSNFQFRAKKIDVISR